VLAAAVALLTGLMGMLLLRRERFFVRAGPGADGGTVLATALLTRGSGHAGPRFATLTDDLHRALDEALDPVPTSESTRRDT